MKCFNEEIYSAYLDNELNQKEENDVTDHLKSCQRCQQLVENLKQENLVIKSSFSMDLPAVNLVEEITERIKDVEVVVPSNGTRFSYSLYTILIVSGIVSPFLILYLFSSFINTFRETLSFFASPASLFFDSFFFLRDILLSTSMIDIPMIFIFTCLPTMMIFYLMSLLFKKGYESS